MKKLLLTLSAFAILTLFPACDWIHYTMMNSIPFKGKPEKNPDVYVYLGIDGLSYHSILEAQKRGIFTEKNWHLSKFITIFPGTSDASWTRIMRSDKLGGYEFENYDPTNDTVVNKGLPGLAKHLMPSICKPIDFHPPYLDAFDYKSDGYMSSFSAYRDTDVSMANTLDNLFFTLEGRAETAKAFSGYMMEIDVLGHMRTSDDIVQALSMLHKRIEKFKSAHPERHFHFTLFSDHGLDFIRVPDERFIEMADEMRKVGINSVESLWNHDPTKEIYALPIMHTRVTYLALHTHPDLIQEVAERISRLDSVDLSVGRLKSPPSTPPHLSKEASSKLDWYGLWAEGRLALYFGFDAATDRYYLPASGDYARLSLKLPIKSPAQKPSQEPEEFQSFSDEELFAYTRLAKYPDLFYRVRTAFAPIGLKYPADVMVSFKPTYASLGFRLPGGAKDIATAGFHGALEELGTLGTLLSDEKDLPDAVRSDTFLDLFPNLKEHIQSLGAHLIETDKNAGLNYDLVKTIAPKP